MKGNRLHVTGDFGQVTHDFLVFNCIDATNHTLPEFLCLLDGGFFTCSSFSLKAQAHAQGLIFLCQALKAWLGSRTFFDLSWLGCRSSGFGDTRQPSKDD